MLGDKETKVHTKARKEKKNWGEKNKIIIKKDEEKN